MPHRERGHWGPPLWDFLHTLTVIDFEDGAANERFGASRVENLRALRGAIPCERCVAIYDEHLALLNTVALVEPMALFRWGWALHNAVNRKMRKPELTLEEALARWTTYVSW